MDAATQRDATSSQPVLPARRTSRDVRRVVFAAAIGNYLEYFEWGLYGFFATVIGAQFFPADDPAGQLLSVLGVFAVGFLFRPIGGLVLGPVGDRIGRRGAMAITLIIMGVATTLIGLLPTYAQVGVWAPILLVVLRCLQGFSTGGEFTSSMTLLMESVPAERRGRYGSLQPIFGALALITASLAALVLTNALDADQLASWGWRIPFLCAALLTLFGIWLRLRLEDSPVFEALQSSNKIARQSVWQLIGKNIRPILVVVVVQAVQGVGYYYLATYAVNFLTVNIGVARSTALTISIVILAGYAVMCYFAGLLLDRVGRRPVQLAGALGFIVFSVPAFLLIATGDYVLIALGLLLLAGCQSLAVVSMVMITIEMFPANSRATAAAAGANFGIVLIAGPGPYVATWLVAITGSPIAAAAYLFVVAAVGFVVLLKWLPETRGRDLLSTDGAMTRSPVGTATDNG